MVRKQTGGRRRGFAMLLLAVAAASICTVTVTTQGSSGLYEQQTVRQRMRDEQGKWMLEAVTQVGLAAACAPNPTAPNQPIFSNTVTAPRPMSSMGYNAGPPVNTGAKDGFGIRSSNDFGLASGSAADMDIRVQVFADYRGPHAVERKISLRGVVLEDDPDVADPLVKRVKVSGSRKRSGWASHDDPAILQ